MVSKLVPSILELSPLTLTWHQCGYCDVCSFRVVCAIQRFLKIRWNPIAHISESVFPTSVWLAHFHELLEGNLPSLSGLYWSLKGVFVAKDTASAKNTLIFIKIKLWTIDWNLNCNRSQSVDTHCVLTANELEYKENIHREYLHMLRKRRPLSAVMAEWQSSWQRSLWLKWPVPILLSCSQVISLFQWPYIAKSLDSILPPQWNEANETRLMCCTNTHKQPLCSWQCHLVHLPMRA